MNQSRRRLCIGLGVFALVQIPLQAKDTKVEIQWRMPRQQVKTVREQFSTEPDIKGDPKTVEGTKGLPVVYILVGAVALVELARALLAVYKDAQYGGVIIRSQKGKLYVENNPKLPGGSIIIQQPNGNVDVKFLAQNNPQVSELVKAMEVLGKK